MCYLLRTKEDYRLCYGEPSNCFVIAPCGSYFPASEYQKLCDEEKEVECHTLMDAHNFPINDWADVCENNRGIVITTNMAEYLLQGNVIEPDTFVELEVKSI